MELLERLLDPMLIYGLGFFSGALLMFVVTRAGRE